MIKIGNLRKNKGKDRRLIQIERELSLLRDSYNHLAKSLFQVMARQNIVFSNLQNEAPELKITKEIRHESKKYSGTTCVCKIMWVKGENIETGKTEYLCALCGQTHTES